MPQGLQVGSNVTYAPTGGTYNWAAEYYSYSKTIGSGDINLYSTTNGTGTNMRQVNWKVFKINKDTGEIQLIPSNVIGSVRLSQAPGYNNAVQLLDGACSALYSHSAKGITARSIDMDDIEPLLDQTKLQNAKNQYNHNNTSSYSHLNSNDQVSTAYTISKSYFPRIYEEENKSVINGNEKSGGLELSNPGSKLYSRTEATSLINQTRATNAAKGYLQASTNIQPYQTYYYWANALSTSSNYANEETASTYSTMLNKTYWVAGRCINSDSDSCTFRVHYVMNGRIDAYSLFCSNLSPDGQSLGLFPVVTLNSELISADGDDFKVDL